MFTVETESHFTGTIQHFTTDEHALAVALYEEAANAGMEPEYSTLRNGQYLLEFYAFDHEFDGLFQAARNASDEAMLHSYRQAA